MTKKGSVIPQYLTATKRAQGNFPCQLAKFADGNFNREGDFGKFRFHPGPAPTLRDCLHGGRGPLIGEVTCGGSPTYNENVIKLK